MVKSKVNSNFDKKNLNVPKKTTNANKEEKFKKQTKISSFFKKSLHSSASSSSLPTPALINSSKTNLANCNISYKDEGAKTSKNESFHSPEKTGNDSDIEIIESTPESAQKKSYITKVLHKVYSPEIIPSTPGCISTISCHSTKFHSFFEPKLRKSHSNIDTGNSSALLTFNGIRAKELSINMRAASKREAETGTGISPINKRNNEGKEVERSSLCKINILNRINPPAYVEKGANEHESNVCPVQAVLDESKVSIEEESTEDDVPCISDVVNVVPLKNKVASIVENSSSGDQINLKVQKIISQDLNMKDHNVNLEQVNAASDCKNLEKGHLDELLSISFDKLSPFKDTSLPVLPISSKNKVEKLLQERLGSLSFVVKGNFGRYITISIENDVYHREILLHLISPVNHLSKFCLLTGFWYESVIKEGDIVHILFAEETNGKYVISNEKGMIIINPDFLLSGTSIVSGVFCQRKAVLNEYFKGYDSGSDIMIIGSLVHQLFQEVMKKKFASIEEIKDLMQALATHPRVLKELYGMGLAEEKVKEEMSKFLPLIQSWSETYLERGVGGKVIHSKDNWKGKITAIKDIEENIWSPRFGIKGKIDLTVQTKLGEETKVVPLELKTGRSSFSAEHQGQVTLYTMMMSDRRVDPKSGLLLYLRDGSMAEVPAREKEKQGLIQLRNNLVQFLTQTPPENGTEDVILPALPEPLDNQRSCSKCSQLLACTALQKVQENTPPLPHGMGSLVPMTLEHLSASHHGYFRKWCLLLHLEVGASGSESAVRSMWCQDASQRESSGTCLSRMTIEGDIEETGDDHFIHKMRRDASLSLTVLPHNFQVGDSVIVSSEKEIALAMGVVYSASQDFLHLALDRNLKLHQKRANSYYQIDRYEYQGNMNISFTNLALLLSPSERSKRLRELIIDGNLPTFSGGLDRNVVAQIRSILTDLNREQQRAVLRSLLANDYSVLKGFPGTGKTSTIIGLVRVLNILGYSVLLTSYTHSAVDNILLKLKSYNEVKFLRLGKVARIHKDILRYSDELQTMNLTSVNQIQDFYENISVVATTCLGMKHVVFRRRTFDFCIMDEASQVLETASLGPLFFCSRFILVGDSLQLPPVIKSHTARSLGMAVSLFERLDNPNATVYLTSQYRMNEPIMALANHLMYEGKLKCAVEELKTASLGHTVSKMDKGPSWLRKLTSPRLGDSVLFVDTLKDALEEKDCSGHFINPLQVQLILILLRAFLDMGVPADEVGVITPYRAQVKLLKERICLEKSFEETVEVNTVDQYQGRDKSVILYSCVRSGMRPEDVQRGEILNDDRRLNVAITRAKRKLIILGDLKTLHNFSPFRKLLEAVERHQVYELKEGLDEFSWGDIRLTDTYS